MLRRSMGILFLALLITTAAVGCGDDSNDSDASGGSSGSSAATDAGGSDGEDLSGDSSDSTDTPLSKAEFVKQANEICKRGQGKIEFAAKAAAQRGDLPVEVGRPGFEAAKTILFPGLKAQIGEIRELTPPPGDEDQIEAFLKALERSIRTIDKGELSGTYAIGDALEPAGNEALKYGLEDCDYGH